MTKRFPIVVLISGNGSNLQAIIDAAEKTLPVDIRAVISNREDAYGLERAKKANIPTEVLQHKNFPNKQAFDDALQQCIDHYAPKLIVLAGFMRILGTDFVTHYRGKLINIHPSLLPKHQGLDTHKKALSANDTEHGVTIHFVTENLDAGPIIAQSKFPITPTDTPETLKSKAHTLEHTLYPTVIQWFAENRLRLEGNIATLDNQPIQQTGATKE